MEQARYGGARGARWGDSLTGGRASSAASRVGSRVGQTKAAVGECSRVENPRAASVGKKLGSGEGVAESVTHEDAGCWNCVYERQHPARETSIDEFFNVMATETLALFEHLEFDFLEEFDVFAPARRGEHRSSPTSTLPSVPALLLQERLRHPSSHARTPEHGRLARLWLRSTAVERRGRSLPSPTSNTSSTRSSTASSSRRCRRGLLDLTLLHRFHRREDDARRPRRVERLRSNRRRVLPRLRLYDRLDRAKDPDCRGVHRRASKRQRRRRCACDALAVEKPIWMLGRQRLRHARLARPPAGRRVVPVAPATTHETPTIRKTSSTGSKPASTNTARTFS